MHDPWRLLCALLWPEPVVTIEQPAYIQPFKGNVYLLPYKNVAVKSCIRNNKFHGHTASARELARILDQTVSRYTPCTIIPIPSGRTRVRQRGYSHLLSILRHSTYRDTVTVALLHKHTDTPSQSHVSKAVRLQQQRDTFRCDPEGVRALSGTVILFDDVVTTGATMAAARSALQPYLSPDATLVCLALAH